MGVAIAFCDESETEYLRDIERLTRKPLEQILDHEWHFPLAIPRPGSPRNRRPPKQGQGAGNRSNRGRRRPRREYARRQGSAPR